MTGVVGGAGDDGNVDGEDGAMVGFGQGDKRGGPHKPTLPENEELGKLLNAGGMLPLSLLFVTLN